VTFSNPSTFDAREWADFVGASPYGDVLQCLEWGAVKKPLWQPIPLAIRDKDSGALKASALVLKRKLGRLNRSIFYLPRGPIVDWADHATARAILHRVKAEARRHRAILIKVDPCVPRFADPGARKILGEMGFVPSPDAQNAFGGTQPRFNMKLDISGSDEEVQARFHQKWRYNTRLAGRKGIVVREVESRDDIGAFHELYRITAERDGFTGRPLKYFQGLWDALVPPGLARFFLTEHEGKPLSGAVCFALGAQCWYVYGASSNESRKLMPNHAMQWAMMQWARARGCTLYDFRGVHDIPDLDKKGADFNVSELSADQLMESEDGLVRFKAGFGAHLTEYIGEFDLPLSRVGYWAWTSARPKLVAALKNRGAPGVAVARD
jgi:lipid II:glycine glycyltransferase (peptidoglycan interpeptide bridge formation enzyme)